TNTNPAENGKTGPDAVIIERLQMAFGKSIEYGKAKIHQCNGSKDFGRPAVVRFFGEVQEAARGH
ncbi:hypothetical protein CU097_003679, partial [Rhizopus azygosporus]